MKFDLVPANSVIVKSKDFKSSDENSEMILKIPGILVSILYATHVSKL